MKVAVHRKDWLHWGGYVVFAGANPLGPRGGRQCNVVDATRQSDPIKDFQSANAFAKNLADTNGWEFLK